MNDPFDNFPVVKKRFLKIYKDGIIKPENEMTWVVSEELYQQIMEKVELTNGITLCRVCHKKEHKNWGKS